MRKILNALALLSLATMARALMPSTAEAAASAGGYWAQVCCGTQCTGGDYCIGSGSSTCCK